ncbi:hypothetical protein D3C85_1644150 [compost metagenome]
MPKPRFKPKVVDILGPNTSDASPTGIEVPIPLTVYNLSVLVCALAAEFNVSIIKKAKNLPMEMSFLSNIG